ncbi:MAG: hypothetical protein ACRC57_05100 [Sarcina sp.]
MNENITLIIGFAIAIALFFIFNKLRVREYLSKVFYGWFKNLPSTLIHIIAFIVNFVVIVAVGIGNSLIMQTWFTLTVFPLALTFILTVTTSMIAVARAVKLDSLRVKPTPKKKPNRVKKK